MFVPMARSSVLLPDILEPVTKRKVPDGADADVVGDACGRPAGADALGLRAREDGRLPLPVRRRSRRLVDDLGERPVRVIDRPECCQRRVGFQGPERHEPGPVWRPARLLPTLQQPEGMKVPQQERL